MKVSYIDYGSTDYFSKTVTDYLNREPKLNEFISYTPDISGFNQAISKRNFTGNRQLLVDILTEQYRKTLAEDIPENVKKNINLLGSESTYTVTTGHQLNIFTGPLYFIFKIITAINLAKELKQNFPEKDFVPVYWMATEDHDFAEINHAEVQGKKISWDENSAGATGRLDTKTIIEAVNQYKSCLGVSENSEKLAGIITEAYCSGRTLADATRSLVNAFFGDYGLVIVDADNASLKTQFAGIIKKDIVGNNSYKNISVSSEKLQTAGYKTQVNAREINFFYLTDNLRERIVFEGDRYFVLNTDLSFSREEILIDIENRPERFSPNVVMRPLYQEVILPNLAYIGGGAEIVYWLQLKSTFEFYGVDFPVLILRNSALVASDNISIKLSRLGLSAHDLFRNTEMVKKDWVLKNSEHTLNLQEEFRDFQHTFEQLKLRTFKIDPSLAPSTEAIKVRLLKALTNLEKKMIKAEKRNHADALSQIDVIKSQYFPGNSLQERKGNIAPFYVKYGPDFIEMLISTFKPLDFKFTVLEP